MSTTAQIYEAIKDGRLPEAVHLLTSELGVSARTISLAFTTTSFSEVLYFAAFALRLLFVVAHVSYRAGTLEVAPLPLLEGYRFAPLIAPLLSCLTETYEAFLFP